MAWGRALSTPLSFLDQILSISKISKLFWRWKLISIRLFWHPTQLTESFKSCPYVANRMSIFLALLDRVKKIISKTSKCHDNLIDILKNIFVFLGKLWVKMSKKGQEKQVPDFHMDAIKEEESCLKCIDIGGNWE